MWTIERKRKRSTIGQSKKEKSEQPKAKKAKKQKQKVPAHVDKKRMSVIDYINMKRMAYVSELNAKKNTLILELNVLNERLPQLTRRYQVREKKDSLERRDEILDELDRIQYGYHLKQFDTMVAPYYRSLKFIELESKEVTRTTIIKVHPKVADKVASAVTQPLEAPVVKEKDETNKSVVLLDEALTGEQKERQLQQQLQCLLQEGGTTGNSVTRVHMSTCDMCLTCNQPTVIMGAGAIMGCTKCKQTQTFIQATASRVCYGEEIEFTSFSYRRENHFQEWVNCFQAKESTEVPASVVELVAAKCLEMGVPDRKDVKMNNVREALKVLGLSKYYENQQQITTRVSGVPAPSMSPQQEEQVRCMFSAIIPFFEKHKPKNRRNFLSYAYCLYKFCELMGWNQFLPCFSLLKGPDKLKKQDIIFQKICKDLDWEFIPSVDEEESVMESVMKHVTDMEAEQVV